MMKEEALKSLRDGQEMRTELRAYLGARLVLGVEHIDAR
jgi:hypothetical protein